MTAHRLKQLAILLAVLLMLWGGSVLLRQGFDSGSDAFELTAASGESIDSILVQRSDGDIRLIKRPEEWTVNGFRADSAGVAQILEQLGEEPAAQLVGRSASSHARFELDEASARTLRVYADGALAVEMLVGKRGGDFQTVYMRRPGEDDVFMVRSRLSTHVDRQLDDWRNKVVAAVEADSVAYIEIWNSDGNYSLRREGDSTWSLNDEPADGNAVRGLLRQYDRVNASGFPTKEQRDSASFDPPDRRVVLRDVAENMILELVMDSVLGATWTRRTGDSVVYRLDQFRANQLTPADSTLRSAGND